MLTPVRGMPNEAALMMDDGRSRRAYDRHDGDADCGQRKLPGQELHQREPGARARRQRASSC